MPSKDFFFFCLEFFFLTSLEEFEDSLEESGSESELEDEL